MASSGVRLVCARVVELPGRREPVRVNNALSARWPRLLAAAQRNRRDYRREAIR